MVNKCESFQIGSLVLGYDAHRILSHGLCNVCTTGSSFFLDTFQFQIKQSRSWHRQDESVVWLFTCEMVLKINLKKPIQCKTW